MKNLLLIALITLMSMSIKAQTADDLKEAYKAIKSIKSIFNKGKGADTAEGKEKISESSNLEQTIQNVNIIANGSASVKERALTNALRNAIEKTFGAFISSTTVIQKESLLYDEIATISQGSIVSYNKISEIQNPSTNEWTITIAAKVSPGKIIEFTKTKGVEVAFKGSLFAQNILIENYYKDQEPLIIQAFLKNLDIFKFYNYSLNIKEPQLHSMKFDDDFFGLSRRDFKLESAIHLKNGKFLDFNQTFNKNEYSGKYYIPIQIEVEVTNYYTQIIIEYVKLLKAIAFSAEKPWEDNESFYANRASYESKYGILLEPNRSALFFLNKNGTWNTYSPLLRNKKTVEYIEWFSKACESALEGSIVFEKIKSNKGQVNDLIFFTPLYGNKEATELSFDSFKSPVHNNRTGYNGYQDGHWFSFLPKAFKNSGYIIYNVGSLQDIQEITLIKLDL